MSKIVEVVAGVLMKPTGEFFLSSRPEGKAYAGYWEFPGGKIEAGETPLAALVRELDEELGIHVTRATPWMTQLFHYEHATVHLHFFRVTAWDAQPHPREGQQFAWQRPGRLEVGPLLPANTPIFNALALPRVATLSCTAEFGIAATLVKVSAAPERFPLLIVREPDMDAVARADFASQLAASVRPAGGRVVLNADPSEAAGLALDGVHLNAARLMATTTRPDFALVGASVHNRAELEHAAAIGCDYALLGHVQATPSHAEMPALGWEGFADIAGGQWPLPVYALGGLTAGQLDDAMQYGAHGIARMRDAWR